MMLGAGVVWGRNNAAGGFPAMSLGARVVSGMKRHRRWVSHCVIRCWGGFGASVGENEPAGEFSTASFPLPRVILPHPFSCFLPFILLPVHEWYLPLLS
jgi:hypothetical protein